MTEKSPPPVPAIAEALIALGPLNQITVDYRQTGTDTAESYLIVWGLNGKKFEGIASLIIPFLDLEFSYNSIAKVKARYQEQHAAWRTWAACNAKDLSEFRRLKNKLGL